MKNPKWLPNTSRNIYPIMEFVGGLNLPVYLLIWNLKLSFLATRCQYWEEGIDLPLGLPMWTLNIHITCSYLANMSCQSWNLLISFGGCFGDVSWVPRCFKGCYIWHDSTMLTDCLLLKLFRNKRKFPPFLEESKIGWQIHPIIYIP